MIKQLANEIKDIAYEIVDAADNEENERVLTNLDMLTEVIERLYYITEKTQP